MRVLMLGWEFPPFITGGLGTACYGLTRAMSRRGLNVTFVLPKSAQGQTAKHVTLLSPDATIPPITPEAPSQVAVRITPPDEPRGEAPGDDVPEDAATPAKAASTPAPRPAGGTGMERVEIIDIPAEFTHPYQRSVDEGVVGNTVQPTGGHRPGDPSLPPEQRHVLSRSTSEHGDAHAPSRAAEGGEASATPPAAVESDYEGDMREVVQRYARFCLAATKNLDFDVIHAHDWMTYPAGLAIARASGKPLVVHIHSTEFDRSGERVNEMIYDIERRGMHGALRVIAVSQLTKNVVINRYGLPEHQVEVVYNGVDLEPHQVGMTGIRSKDKIVLYFGRITYQKGPEYFIQAAKRVLEVMPDVKFVVAGSGDLAKRMIEMAADLGIGHKVLFTGFLRGADIPRVFNLADLYVMPSVSEPFGIAPLEAMSHNVPVLISKSSGVSEVLKHALKVDFWDTDDMANKIIAVLRHPPLSQTLKEHGAFEVRRLTWDGAAERCEQIYTAVQREMTGRAAGVNH